MKLSTAAGQRPRERANRLDALPFAEFEVQLPATLERFGKSIRASICGSTAAPVVVMLGGISANRFPCLTVTGLAGWWASLAHVGGPIDPSEFQILGIEFAADEQGRYAPSTLDQAQVIRLALDTAGVPSAHAIVGASYGGMAALSLAQHHPERVERLIILSAGAEPHPASTAGREIQRRIVALGLETDKGDEGLSIARGLAMTSYRTRDEFEQRFSGGIAGEETLTPSEPGAYLRARGEAYRSVMSPGRFLSLSASIDRHRVEPAEIKQPALFIGSTSDQLVPPSQIKSLSSRYGGPSRLHLVPSFYGHDMFLKDADQLAELIHPFLRSN